MLKLSLTLLLLFFHIHGIGAFRMKHVHGLGHILYPKDAIASSSMNIGPTTSCTEETIPPVQTPLIVSSITSSMLPVETSSCTTTTTSSTTTSSSCTDELTFESTTQETTTTTTSCTETSEISPPTSSANASQATTTTTTTTKLLVLKPSHTPLTTANVPLMHHPCNASTSPNLSSIRPIAIKPTYPAEPFNSLGTSTKHAIWSTLGVGIIASITWLAVML